MSDIKYVKKAIIIIQRLILVLMKMRSLENLGG